MEDLIDLIATDAAPSDISDKIKELMYTKAGEKVEYARPLVASAIFDDAEQDQEDYD